MIANLQIKNFKSIKQLNLDCNKINLFIGEPNAGKSNILETIGLFSFIKFGQVEDFVRLEAMTNLFRDENLDEILSIEADSKVLEIAFKNDIFQGRCYDKESNEELFSFSFDFKLRGSRNMFKEPFPVRFYRFSLRKEFYRKEAEFLLPPSGDNLLTIIRSHKKIKDAIADLFEPFGLRLVFRLQENKIEIMKQQQNDIITYPYWLLSDTLQRIIFYTTAIDSNKDSILIFEEPESNSFPYYTKFLGEKIAFDEMNQYFIATHNPYLLLAILEKAKKNSVNVFVTYYDDYQTKVKLLDNEQVSELMNFDPFFNLDAFIGRECHNNC
jgi:AAA15 family ATPase/GTPase